MNRSTRIRMIIALMAVLVLLLGACGRSAEAPAAEEPAAEAPAAEEPAAEEPAAEEPTAEEPAAEEPAAEEAATEEPAAEEAATEEPAAEEPAAEGEAPTVAFSVPAMSFPFFVHMEKQLREAAEAQGVEIVTLDGQDNTEKQAADLESVIAQGLDGLIVSPRTTEGLVDVIQAVVDAGIPVVTVDRQAPGVEGLLAHVGAENVLGGEAQGQALVEMFPDGAVIFELQGTPGASPAIDRGQGLHNIIDPAGNFEISCQQTGNFNRADGLKVTESCLSANTPDAIVAANDDMALGAAEAVSAAGLEVPIIGYDALPEALKAIQDGSLYGSVEQFPGQQVSTSLDTILAFINEDVTPESDTIFITPEMITSDNVDMAERVGEVQ